MNATNWIIVALCAVAGLGHLIGAALPEHSNNWRWLPCASKSHCECNRWVFEDGEHFSECRNEYHNDWVNARLYRRWTADMREWLKDMRANWSGK